MCSWPVPVGLSPPGQAGPPGCCPLTVWWSVSWKRLGDRMAGAKNLRKTKLLTAVYRTSGSSVAGTQKAVLWAGSLRPRPWGLPEAQPAPGRSPICSLLTCEVGVSDFNFYLLPSYSKEDSQTPGAPQRKRSLRP